MTSTSSKTNAGPREPEMKVKAKAKAKASVDLMTGGFGTTRVLLFVLAMLLLVMPLVHHLVEHILYLGLTETTRAVGSAQRRVQMLPVGILVRVLRVLRLERAVAGVGAQGEKRVMFVVLFGLVVKVASELVNERVEGRRRELVLKGMVDLVEEQNEVLDRLLVRVAEEEARMETESVWSPSSGNHARGVWE